MYNITNIWHIEVYSNLETMHTMGEEYVRKEEDISIMKNERSDIQITQIQESNSDIMHIKLENI